MASGTAGGEQHGSHGQQKIRRSSPRQRRGTSKTTGPQAGIATPDRQGPVTRVRSALSTSNGNLFSVHLGGGRRGCRADAGPRTSRGDRRARRFRGRAPTPWRPCGPQPGRPDSGGPGRTKLMGVCLGIAVAHGSSREFGTTKGLGLIPRKVVACRKRRQRTAGEDPHIGWEPSSSRARRTPGRGRRTVLQDRPRARECISCISYHVVPARAEAVVAVTHVWNRLLCSNPSRRAHFVRV